MRRPSSSRVLTFYRTALRVTRNLPLKSLRHKTQYNIRDGIELYRYETDPRKIKSLLESGYEDIGWLNRWSKVSPETIESIKLVLLNSGVEE
ncbi:hypothetical protein IWQ61_009030 [Dispira simplex]|nr:hypothetical protein IWQ61_009030 [Dispira simplex]